MKFKHTLHTLLVVVATGLFLSGVSHAKEFSIGVLAGTTGIDDIKEGCMINCVTVTDDTDTSVGVNLAYNFNDTWGIELGYLDLGTFSMGTSGVYTQYSAEVDASATYLVGTSTLAISDRWSLTGRLGLASLDMDSVSSQSFETIDSFSIAADHSLNANTSFRTVTLADSDNSEGVMVGLSIDYSLSDSLKAGFRYDTISDGHSIALGLQYSL